MTIDEVRGVVGDLAARVGLPSTVSGHLLRRSWATHAYLRGPDSLGAISLHLRHSRIDNTVRYVEDLALHLVDPDQLLDRDAVVTGPGGQLAPAKDVGFDVFPLAGRRPPPRTDRAPRTSARRLRAEDVGVDSPMPPGCRRSQVQRHGRWSNIRSVDPCYRKTEVWGCNSPSQRLAGS